MSFDFDSTTINKEEDGVRVDFSGARFLIASIGSLRFQQKFAALQRPHKRQIDSDRLDPATALDIMCKALAFAVLLGWEDVVDSKGIQVKYSRKAAEDLLRRNAVVRKFVQDFSMDVENFNQEELIELGE